MLRCLIDWLFPPTSECLSQPPFIASPYLTLFLFTLMVVLLLCQALHHVQLRNQFREIFEAVTLPKKFNSENNPEPDSLEALKKLKQVEALVGDILAVIVGHDKKVKQAQDLLLNLTETVNDLRSCCSERSNGFKLKHRNSHNYSRLVSKTVKNTYKVSKPVRPESIDSNEEVSVQSNSTITEKDDLDTSSECHAESSSCEDSLNSQIDYKNNQLNNSKIENDVLALILARNSPLILPRLAVKYIVNLQRKSDAPLSVFKRRCGQFVVRLLDRELGYLERPHFVALMYLCLKERFKRKCVTKKKCIVNRKKKALDLTYVRNLRRYYSEAYNSSYNFKPVSYAIEKKCTKRLIKERVVRFFKSQLVALESKTFLFHNRVKELCDKRSENELKVVYSNDSESEACVVSSKPENNKTHNEASSETIKTSKKNFKKERTPELDCCSDNIIQNALSLLPSKVSSFLKSSKKSKSKPKETRNVQLIDDLIPRAKQIARDRLPAYDIPHRGVSFKPQLLSGISYVFLATLISLTLYVSFTFCSQLAGVPSFGEE